jgi:serine phosphatase RsbU (regulator of sigma subunit)
MVRFNGPSGIGDTDVAQPLHDDCVAIWTSPAHGAPTGGDWSEVVSLSEDVVALTIGDVAGHGAAAASTMRAIRSSVLEAIRETREPSAVLAAANAAVVSRRDDTIVTAIVGFFDKRSLTLTYANAGHPPPYLATCDRSGFLTRKHADLPLGVFARYHAENYVLALPPGALFVIYTDGITEHERDPIAGEVELAEAAHFAWANPELDAARAIAEHVLRKERGDDDAATMVLRTAQRPVRYARSTRGTPAR